ncbi:MAG: hypothetical protein SFW36_10260 [Leptolyngbyaceae cyanobacterium bins.59]|nr:hypothetical protein [Leptolyngbyaceae cyanobacterium bins.59]
MAAVKPIASQSEQPLHPRRPYWWIAAVLLILSAGGVSGWAVMQLLYPPQGKGCSAVSIEDLPATRLHCGDVLAADGQEDKLERAIALVDTILPDDPLRRQANTRIQEWSLQLLTIAEDRFQEGNLEGAIDLAESVPIDASVRKTANDRIQRWKTTWEKAESIYQEVETDIAQDQGYAVLHKARRLLTLGNTYWATTRYQELVQQIQTPPQKGEKRKPNDPRNAFTAATASALMTDYQRERSSKDRDYLQRAQSLASSGKVEDLESAIAEAEMVFYDGPQYEQAQQLIKTWRQQVDTKEDRAYLERATELASKGDAYSLQAAIDQASWITRDRPLYSEAEVQVEQWKRQMMEMQSQPRIDRPQPAIDRPPVVTPVQSVHQTEEGL